MGIPCGVLQAQFLDQTGFARARATAVKIGSHRMHPDFTRGIASEDRAILDQDDTSAIASGGQRGANAGQATSHDDKVGVKFVAGHRGKQVRAGQRTSRGRGDMALFFVQRGRDCDAPSTEIVQ